MGSFMPVAKNIYRLRVPFDSIYTSVFAVRTPDGDVLIDAATTPSDVRNCILPAAESLGLRPRWLLLTHDHGDHAGGAPALTAHFPALTVGLMGTTWATAHPGIPTRLLHDGEVLANVLTVYALPGHAPDAMGVLDRRVGALICGDCVQVGGVGRHGTGLTDGAAYLRTLARIRSFPLSYLFPAHAYFPLGERAVGADEIAAYLDESESVVRRIAREIRFIGDDRRAAAHYNLVHSGEPPIGAGTVRALRRGMVRNNL